MTLREAFLKQSQQELHTAVQLVASVGPTYLPAQKGDRHTALLWDERGWIISPEMRPGKSFEVALDIAQLQLHFLGHADAPKDQPSDSLTLKGHTLKSAYTWLEKQLATYLNRSFEHVKHLNEMPYTLPAHPIQKGSLFSFHDAALKTCEQSLRAANAQIAYLQQQYRSNAHPIRIWPEHLTLSSLFYEADREIEAGFSFPTREVPSFHYFLKSTQVPKEKPTLKHGQWQGDLIISTAESPQEITAFLTENMQYLWVLPHQSEDIF